jgi:3',5'-cyclic AMP phosphodiesterase CpdA
MFTIAHISDLHLGDPDDSRAAELSAALEPQPHVWNDAPPSLAVHLVGDDSRVTTHRRALV